MKTEVPSDYTVKPDQGSEPHRIGPNHQITPLAISYFRQKEISIILAKRLVEETIVLTDPIYHDGTECVLVPKGLYLTLKASLEKES